MDADGDKVVVPLEADEVRVARVSYGCFSTAMG